MYVPTIVSRSGNQESQAQFETRIKYWVYVRRIMRCTMIEKAPFVSQNGVRKIGSVACGFRSIEIHFPDCLKSLISRLIENYVFFNKMTLQRYFIEKKLNL